LNVPSLAPLLQAGPVIATHAGAALAAFAVGVLQLARRKGTPAHRVLGWMWIVLMAVVAVGSFFIHNLRQVGPFSAIHILSVVTLVNLGLGIGFARTHRVDAHRWTMISVFLGALVVAGLFTLVPGRIMHRVVFGS
jgi:uncharacterized membrane protein